MRNIVAHLLHLAHQCLDALQHQVEVFRNAIPFVMAAAERDTLVEAALHDGTAGGVDLLDPPDSAARHQNAREPRKHHQQGADRDHGGLDLIGKVVELADVPAYQ